MTIKLSHKFYTDDDYNRTRVMLIMLYKACQVSGEALAPIEQVHLHHRLINSEYNRETYPYFIDSVFNLVPVLRKYQDQENRIKLSEDYARVINDILEMVSRSLWMGRQITAEEILRDGIEWKKFSFEIGRIREYQRTRGNLHYNVTLTKSELADIDKDIT